VARKCGHSAPHYNSVDHTFLIVRGKIAFWGSKWRQSLEPHHFILKRIKSGKCHLLWGQGYSHKLVTCWSLLSKYGNSTLLRFVGFDYSWSSIRSKLSWQKTKFFLILKLSYVYCTFPYVHCRIHDRAKGGWEILVEEPWVQLSNWGHWKSAAIIWLLSQVGACSLVNHCKMAHG
jgi:hypothetical protein